MGHIVCLSLGIIVFRHFVLNILPWDMLSGTGSGRLDPMDLRKLVLYTLYKCVLGNFTKYSKSSIRKMMLINIHAVGNFHKFFS